MRGAMAAGIGISLLGATGSLAGEAPSLALSPQSASLSEAAPRPWRDAGADGYQLATIAAGTVVVVIAANILTGGMITPLFTFSGPAAASATASAGAASASGIGVGAGALLIAAPAAMASMGMMTPLIGTAAPAAVATAGGAAATAGAAGTSAVGGAGLGMAVGTAAEMSVMVAAPAALAEVGEPIHEALRDGYTTPSVLIAAVGESTKRAGEMVIDTGAYLGSAVRAWWTQ